MPRYEVTSIFEDECLYVATVPGMVAFSMDPPQVGKEADWEAKLRSRLEKALPTTLHEPGFEAARKTAVSRKFHSLPDQATENGLRQSGWQPCNVEAFRQESAETIKQLQAIWSTHFQSVPQVIAVHLTQHGQGGSYHPGPNLNGSWNHVLAKTRDAISIRPSLQLQTWHPAAILAHETTHLAINSAVEAAYSSADKARLYRIKEAIVDRILESRQYRSILGITPLQKDFRGCLPSNWQALPCIKEPFDWSE